ncbi:hypothetical protein MAL08_04730 [Leptospira noguchii]|uniref:Uncharacterized protein n=4 Tax=Leptospira noguchii TaxID=28182 RepID=M6Y4L1_9LEPT|nr:hypothetical protein [Leptospira noguchii]EMO27767.1 hypothetical protein LEP1GSC170_3150 [Leptospira interrogans serovar Bataviae str. HAI135]EKR72159.1 hypothetical protein LEP1GSC041_2462 [Leptospira noguchii str. 2006001870]EMI60638.1 hypothetical protein LEP1GSC072_1737 [Leptospira noguchii str. Bonito]EMM98221.1 hypothetical protein LEP1GSC035_0422 [Leptospira noguchii str. 2007001578]EMO39387.1 hypothetical protein LEP1GSC186_1268 [Leptospira noguchii serovar Autumnalis str. ZUN142]
MKPGDKVKIIKRTFLHNGIFVHTNTIVEIISFENDKLVVLFHDKEGFTHHIESLTTADVVPV